MSEKTAWIDGSLKPERIGVYERRNAGGDEFIFPFYFWDGCRWRGSGSRSPQLAIGSEIMAVISTYQNASAQWRGLANKPEDA